jgi:serine/threonine protein kinase
VVVVYQWHQKWSKTRIPHNFGPQLTALARITRDNTGSNILAEGLEVLTPTELNRNLITMTNELGTGEFGVVFKALFKSKNRMTTFEYEVAVKLTKADGETPTDRGRLLDEATVVAQFSHKNVVSLVGVVTVGSPTLLVFQYCAKGSLQQLLRSRRRFPGSNTVQSLLVYASGICDGMAYLATRRFVHRDLAARNILVDSNSTPKISDFGLSRELQMSAYYLTSNEHRDSTKIPVRWTAPEALKSHRFSEKSDVWSFAVVCHEIFTYGQVPYRTWTNAHVIEEVLKGQRLPPPPTMPAVLATQMHQCYLADADERPAFAKLAKLLREIVDAEQDYPDEELDTPRDTDVVAEGFNSAVSPYAVVKLRPRSASLASVGAVDTAGVALPTRSSTCPDTWDDTMSAPRVVTASESQDSGVDAAASPAPNLGYTAGYVQASVIDAAEVLSCTSGPTVTTVHHPFPIAKEAPTENLVNPILVLEGDGGGGLARESLLI